MPLVQHVGPLGLVAAGSHGQRDAFVIEPYRRFGVLIIHGHQVTSAAYVMAFALNQLPLRLAGLGGELSLLVTYPTELADRVRSGHIWPRGLGYRSTEANNVSRYPFR